MIAEVSGGVVGSYQRLADGATSYIDTNLSPNVVYQYKIVPYDMVDFSGISVTTPATSVIPTISVGAVNVDTTDISLSFLTASTFYDVSVARITNASQGAYVPLAAHQTTYVDMGAFTADSSYQYNMIAYNASGTQSATVKSIVVSPLANITSTAYTTVTTSQISLTYGSSINKYY
jgi:hypothetical protein